jgi:hypothetical protein
MEGNYLCLFPVKLLAVVSGVFSDLSVNGPTLFMWEDLQNMRGYRSPSLIEFHLQSGADRPT